MEQIIENTKYLRDSIKQLEIKEWIDRCSKYLDSCGLRPEKPLWKFNIKDPTTHISSPDFAYKHLLRPNDKPIYTNRCYA